MSVAKDVVKPFRVLHFLLCFKTDEHHRLPFTDSRGRSISISHRKVQKSNNLAIDFKGSEVQEVFLVLAQHVNICAISDKRR